MSTPKIFTGSEKPGLVLVTAIRDALAAAGMPRTSTLNGGEMNGLMPANHGGSTGFSVHFVPENPDQLRFHLVISGRVAGLAYREYEDHRDEETYSLHEPINPELLCPRIQAVFEGLGFQVHEVRNSGHQTMWDDDVDYSVRTNNPNAEKDRPAPLRPRRAIYGGW